MLISKTKKSDSAISEEIKGKEISQKESFSQMGKIDHITSNKNLIINEEFKKENEFNNDNNQIGFKNNKIQNIDFQKQISLEQESSNKKEENLINSNVIKNEDNNNNISNKKKNKSYHRQKSRS